MTAWGCWFLALGGGVAWAMCFGRQPLTVAPWLALIPLLLLLGQRRAAVFGFLYGLVFWLCSLSWIVGTLEAYGHLPSWLAGVSFLALAAYLALFYGIFAGLGAIVWKGGIGTALLGLPALWVVSEWLRGWLFSGFPWNLAAYAWVGVPGALALSSWVGAIGVSWLVLFTGSGLAWAVSRRRWQVGALAVGLGWVALAVAARWASPASPPDASMAAPVRVLQPNSAILTDLDADQIGDNYRKVFQLSRLACDEPGALIVWPESGAWPYSYARHRGFRKDLERLARSGCPLLVNSSMEEAEGVFNSVLLITENGVESRYDKRHLVPFGEYVPMSGWLPFLSKIARHAGDFLPGDSPSLLTWDRQILGPAICFEVTFPGQVAEAVRAGATLLVTVTNDGWYGDSWAPWQHFTAARFRAAETRRYLVRAALTGISAFVAPDGSIEQYLGVGEHGTLAARVAGRSDLTPYARAPWLVPAVCIVIAAFAILLSRRRSRT